jgi:ribosomal-protein-alanine N-acetyltransferase
MLIQCQSCVLRPLVASDAGSLARYANNPAVAQNLRDRFPHPYSLADAEWYIAHVASRAVQTSFGIVVDGEAIGSISLMLGDDISRCSAEIGYWIGQPFWGRGIATDALRAATKYAFETFDLTRIFAVPFVSTQRSSRVLEKAGYVREGLMRRSAIKNGVIHDQWLYAIYQDDACVPTV